MVRGANHDDPAKRHCDFLGSPESGIEHCDSNDDACAHPGDRIHRATDSAASAQDGIRCGIFFLPHKVMLRHAMEDEPPQMAIELGWGAESRDSKSM